MARRKKKLWFGFLDAGKRSSPVVRDESLDTGNPNTIYIFNFMKGRILEYRREIVEPKLREPSTEERSMVNVVNDAYKKERAVFTPRRDRRATRKPIYVDAWFEPEIPDFVVDDDWSQTDGDRCWVSLVDFAD